MPRSRSTRSEGGDWSMTHRFQVPSVLNGAACPFSAVGFGSGKLSSEDFNLSF